MGANKTFNWKIPVVLYLVSQIFFLIYIQFPSKFCFDEFHYVPSAKQFLALTTNQNWEHPPLGKLLMAVGIGIWGDRPIGWRFMSTIFGAVTLVAFYFLGWVLFASEEAALWVALATLFNQLLYVQARIGMLDTFMMGFLAWALVLFLLTLKGTFRVEKSRLLLLYSGILFGLALSSKWFSVVPWVACWILVGTFALFRQWGVSFGAPKSTDWYKPTHWQGLRWDDWVLLFGAVPVIVYFLTFIPFFFVPGAVNSLSDLISMQYRMYDGQLRVVSSHPYMSNWLDWPLLTRPIWYAFDHVGDKNQWARGVLLLGNPLLMWSGLLAVIYCFWDWLKSKDLNSFLIFYFYSAFYFCWSLIPRKIAFYYYYYPAGLILSLALAQIFFSPRSSPFFRDRSTRWAFMGATVAIFCYFFPILSGYKIGADAFRQWMWFSRWI